MRDLNRRKRREQRSRLLNLRSLRCLLFKASFSLFGSLSLRSSALTFATFALKPAHRHFLRCVFNAEDAEVLAKERRGGKAAAESTNQPGRLCICTRNLARIALFSPIALQRAEGPQPEGFN